MKIIAEIGSNWKTIDDCILSIKKAKEAGANFVKFQLFNSFELYGASVDLRANGTPYLPQAWLERFAFEAEAEEIKLMCTAFSPAGYEIVDRYVSIHKIASAELTDVSILKTVNSFKKPVILSTAGSSIDEIRAALGYLKDCPVTVMYCVGDYPARVVDFRKLLRMQSEFGPNYSYGYSDHSLDVLNIPYMAMISGASFIEKHVNFTHHNDTNDAGHSLNYSEFEAMCRVLRNQNPTLEETESISNNMMKAQYKRRFVATTDIKVGDAFKIGVNVGYYRATSIWNNPVSTFHPEHVEGKFALGFKKPGDVICYPDIAEEGL